MLSDTLQVFFYNAGGHAAARSIDPTKPGCYYPVSRRRFAVIESEPDGVLWSPFEDVAE